MTGTLGDLPGTQYAAASIQRQGNQVRGDRRARGQLLIDVGDDSLDLITSTGGESGAERRHRTVQFIEDYRCREWPCSSHVARGDQRHSAVELPRRSSVLEARASNRLSAIAFAAGIGPSHAATLEVRGHKTGRMISFPVVVADYQGGRYLVAMLGQKTQWARNLRADGRAVLLMRRRRENVSLVEDLSGDRGRGPAPLPRGPPGARPFFPLDRHAPLADFERIVHDYPVFRFV